MTEQLRMVSPQLLERASLTTFSKANAKAVAVGDGRLLCRALGRYKMFVEAQDVSFSPHLAMDGYWEPWVTVCIAHNVKPGWKCINVGAHVGYYTVLMAELVGEEGRVFAYEANPRTFSLLCDNIDVNGLSARAKASWRAVSNVPGGEMYCIVNPKSGINTWVTPGKTAVPVQGTVLDAEHGDDPIDFLLCDSEGHEPMVLAGASGILEKNPNIQMLLEWSPERYEAPKMTALALLGMGFHTHEVTESGTLRAMTPEEFTALEKETMVWFKRTKEIPVTWK